MPVRLILGALGTVVVLAMSGCQSGAGVDSFGSTTSTLQPSDLGGDRLPVQVPSEPITHASVPIRGTFTLEANGCWIVDLGDQPRIAVFPEGTTKPADDGAVLVVPEGVVVESGTAFDGSGGVALVDDLPGGEDGFWGSYVAFCESDAVEVAVLDHVEAALDVEALTPTAVASIVAEARLTEMWGCGIGFAVTDDRQRVALHLYAHDSGEAVHTTIELPDPTWTTTVTVGSLLMASHCDDAIEGWEAEPRVAGTYPLVAGTIRITQVPDSLCSGGRAVGSLSGATVIIDGSEIVLDDLDLENDAFGCFAG